MNRLMKNGELICVAAAVAAGILSTGCAAPGSDGDDVAAAAAPIVGGYDDVVFDGSGRVEDSSSSGPATRRCS